MPARFPSFFPAMRMGNENSTCIALLHNVVENHGDRYGFSFLTESGFPAAVTEALRLMTHDENVPCMEYVEAISRDPIVSKVKLVNLKHDLDKRRTAGEKPKKMTCTSKPSAVSKMQPGEVNVNHVKQNEKENAMCTTIAKKGNDLLYGFNLDIDPDVWHFDLYKTENYFTVGITVGKTVYFTHGINQNGQFGNVPYMNGARFKVPRGKRRERIDLMTNRYIRGKYAYTDILEILRTKTITCIPAATMHSLIGNRQGDFLIVEPGYGVRKVEADFAVITNFPVLTELPDYGNPFYGKDRYDKAYSVLKESGDDFSVDDALALLNDVRQDGKWSTKVSFVYSANENAVHYCLNGDFSDVRIHRFG